MSFSLVRYLGSAVMLTAAASVFLALPGTAQDGAPRPMAAVPGGPVGSEVFISMSGGLAPGARVSLGFGGLSGGYELLGRAEAGPDGVLSTTVTVPSWAEPNLVYHFFLNLGGGVRVFSDPFIVTGPGGALQVVGSVSEVIEGCVLLTGLDETRYALAGVTAPVAVGERVTVEGNLGVGAGAVAGPSPCAGRPGIPVRVRTIRGG
jgi:hypothetical protein